MKKYRIIHLDLKLQMPKLDYLFKVVKKLKNLGANSLLIEYEDKFPYQSHPEIVHPSAFKREELKEFIRYTESLGIEIIPLVQSLSHVGYVLRHKKFQGLREDKKSTWQYCPKEEKTFSFLMDIYDEVIDMHPKSSYVHLGCDETWNLCRCDKCKKLKPAESFSQWVNLLNREVKKRWKKKTMIWGDMMIPFTCKFPTYPKIADMLNKDIVICYWDYWNDRVFPSLDFYQKKGFKVITSSSTEGEEIFPVYQERIRNIAGFIKRSSQYKNVIGHLITYWVSSGRAPFEAALFGFGVGLKAMENPERDLQEIEKEVINELYGTNDEQLIDVFYLLGRLPDKMSAPWKYQAAQQSKEILNKFDKSNSGIQFLTLIAEIYAYKAKKVETLFNVKNERIEKTKAKSLLEKLLQKNQKLKEKTKNLYQIMLKREEVDGILKRYFESDRRILAKAKLQYAY